MAAHKEGLSDEHMERPFDYANEHIDWSLIDWSFGVYIDEFTVCSGDNGRLWVWRTNGTRYNAENIALIQNTRRFSVSFIAR